MTDGHGHPNSGRSAANGSRRYREKKRSDGAIALTRRPSKERPDRGRILQRMGGSDAPTDGRASTRATRGGRISWQREPLDMAGAAGGSWCFGRRRKPGSRAVGLALGGARLQLGHPVLIVEPTARPAAVEFARERLEPLLSSKPFAGILHGERHGGLGTLAAVPLSHGDDGRKRVPGRR